MCGNLLVSPSTDYCEPRADVYRVLAVHVHGLHPSAEGVLAEAQNVSNHLTAAAAAAVATKRKATNSLQQ